MRDVIKECFSQFDKVSTLQGVQRKNTGQSVSHSKESMHTACIEENGGSVCRVLHVFDTHLRSQMSNNFVFVPTSCLGL